ncbi:bromodomain-containing protein 4B [Culex pipiens pallens]|uniref:bromodomain-containing protein 4B n=1 Tax=Culex pipiens pallens TaxID=42434 RepID=UPI0019534418|nr:bromodomain-containing protein 4B [Culex pipiens pallens]
MRKCCLLLLLPVVLGTRSPAAVFEDVFELGRPAVAYLTTPENQNGMHAYLTKRNRQMAEPQGMMMSASSYAWANPAANERYQSFEETENDRIRMENLKRIASVRTKRLDALAHPPPPPPAKKARGQQQQLRKPKQVNIVPREVFKFTLEDAMIHPKVESSSKNKRRVKRELGVERVPKRLEPVPREILWFEAKDAITQSPQEGQGAIHQRRKRSADPGNNEGRDVVSFQLQDAKTADRDSGLFNKQLIEENPNLRMPFMTSDNFKRGSVFDEIVERPEPRRRERKKEKRENQSDDSDLNIEESRRVKVRGGKKKLANYEDLPLGVQKAIDIAIQENERMNGKISEEPPRSPPKYYFGDKKPKTKKPFSSTTSAKPSFPSSPKESKFSPSPPIETGFVPSKPMSSQDSSENIKPEKSNPGAWWPVSNLNRSKRLQQKATYPPLVVSPQYVHTYKPTMESYKMKELSQSYEQSQSFEHSHENSYEIPESSKEYHQEKPKIKYVIKEIPVRMKESRTKITVQPTISISYDKEPTGSGSSSESDSKDYNNPYGPVELRYEQPKESPKSFANLKIVVPDSKEQSESSYYDDNHVVEHPNPTEASHSSESYEKTGSSIAALSALIGKRPTIQLKGLNDLLGMPIPIGNQQPLQKLKTRVRPQDNTAPILFPGESSTPTPPPAKKMPGYRSVQIENGPKILYEDNSSPSTLYHTVQMNPQLKVPMTKDYTPIKEVVSDIADSDLIGPTIATPTHATYIISSSSTPVPPTAESEHSYESSGDISNQESASYLQEVHSTPETIVEPISVQYQTRQVNYKQHQHQHHVKHYEEHEEDEHEHAAHHKYHGHHFDHPHSDHHHHHDDDEHSEDYDDGEGYAFGYRVRDFHTGNDFGHIQNRDNGVTRGEYHILLPDGRVQNVRYHADEKGFHAEVSYESVHGSSSESSSSSSSSK